MLKDVPRLIVSLIQINRASNLRYLTVLAVMASCISLLICLVQRLLILAWSFAHNRKTFSIRGSMAVPSFHAFSSRRQLRLPSKSAVQLAANAGATEVRC